ncbi:unnamed protein product [Mytilus edulis]|uniref:C2H2-type domain-containing protein n=1 Tax=Mytilus edulis TaxID=6550 RepID=A0A8S3RR45_MYTED|nr:unnamed protein product [Mytilus edulis]
MVESFIVNALDESFEVKEELETEPSSMYCCTFCSYSSKYKQNVKRHKQNAHAPGNNAETKHFTMFLCDQCGSVFKTAGGLNIHYKGKHTQEFRFKCKVCDRGFNTLWNYRGHITTHEPVLRHRCDVCDKTFAYKETLKQHITSVHTSETSIIICSKEGCGASCNSQKSLKEHFLAVHGGRVLNFSIDISENVDDHEVQPSFNITLRPNIVNGSEEQEIEEAEDDSTEGDKSEEEAIDIGPGVKRITTKNIDKFISEQPLLVYRDCLLMLANTNTEQICTMSDCNRQVDLKTETIGSAFYITWVCREGHILNKWCSQPLLNRAMHCGDLMLASATVSSGNDFQKMELFCKILGLPILNSSTFSKIQKSYIVPSIEEYWLKHLEDIYTEFSRKEIVVLGDSRMDHCTHSCTHTCTYTLMEMETKRILCIVTMDEPMTEGKGTSLEKRCFEKGLKILTDAGLNIIEVVTDSHPQIRALMKKPQYASIKHSFDIWHGLKNLGKKIIKGCIIFFFLVAGFSKRGKENILLLEWTKEIMNHYWHCASVSKNEGEFKGSWFKILHHVVNEHTWLLSYDDSFDNNKCNHGPLSEERENKYMEKGSDAHTALRYIVMDIRLLKDIPYYLNCRSISDLESFQNLISAYTSEPHVYRPDMYRVRNQLAALDHNIHIGRPALTKDNGAPRFQREFNQKSSRWSVQEIKVKKRYPHLSAVVHSILTARLNNDVG